MTGNEPIPTLVSFFETVGRSNPFRSNRVSSVPRAESSEEEFVDVPSLHQKEFRRLKTAVCEVRESCSARGFILSGGAGVGKSHLLAKLCRWAETEKTACFVYLHNVIASPERMPRHFLRSVVSVLVEGRESYSDCWLYRLVKHAIRQFWKNKRNDAHAVCRLSPAEARVIFLEAAQQLPLRSDPINSQVFEVLFKFFEQVNLNPKLSCPTREMVDAMVDWLSGDSISESAAISIGVAPQLDETEGEELVRLRDEHHIEQVLLILCELCGLSRRAFLICLDQFDNLNTDQVRVLSRFLHTFIDHARNLLMISAGVRQTMETFRADGSISTAQWDRIGQQETTLYYSSAEEMRDLISARLKPLRSRFQSLPEVAAYFDQHAMFPLAEKDFELRFGSAMDIRPRDVLSWAAEAWQDQQDFIEDKSGKEWLTTWEHIKRTEPDDPGTTVIAEVSDPDSAIDAVVARAVNEMIADRREHPGALPPDADNLSVVTEKLLKVCVDSGLYSIKSVTAIKPARGKLPVYHLEVVEQEKQSNNRVTNGVAFLTSRNGNAARHALNRLLNLAKKIDRRILVTDEERAPLPKTPVTAQHYSGLEKLGGGFQHIKLNFQRYAELDSLRSVIDQAGDLVVARADGQYSPLTRAEVVQSLIRQRLLLKHPLLKELLEEPGNNPVTQVSQKLPSLELIETVIRGNLGFRISVTSNAVTSEILGRSEFKDATFEVVHDLVLKTGEQLRTSRKFIVKDHVNALLFMNSV